MTSFTLVINYIKRKINGKYSNKFGYIIRCNRKTKGISYRGALGADGVYIRFKETLKEYFDEGALKNPDIAAVVGHTISTDGY